MLKRNKKDEPKEKAKSKSSRKQRKRLANQTYIYSSIGESQRFFVFGLHWEVILGSDLNKQAYKEARKQNANYYLRGTTRSNAVGLLQTNKANGHPELKHELYSMAAVFARTLPQGSFAMRFLTPKGYWFMIGHDGVVQEGTDCFYESIDEIDEQIEYYRSQWNNLLVYGDQVGDHAVPDLASLMGQINQQTRLKRASINLASIPRWVWLVGIALVAYKGYEYAEKEWGAYERKKKRALMAQIEMDPVAEWTKQINSWSKNTYVLGKEGLYSWIHALSNIPAYVGRWELVDMTCSATGSCVANYQRMKLGSLDRFEDYMPQGWEVNPIGLNQLQVTFTIPLKLTPLADLGLENLPAAKSLKRNELNLFQRITPITRTVTVGPVSPTSISPPLQPMPDGSTKQIAFPGNSNLTMPLVSTFNAVMPLRSLIMLDWDDNYTIDRVGIKRVETEIKKDSSMFELIIDGGFYAKD